jgi:2-polyprenyl-3-methyl-5-hydroxy-6-metoxy-1,4-benzoquinol methylase
MSNKKRVNRGKVARGGASQRKTPSIAAQWLVDHAHVPQQDLRVLDYGCGFGMDAETFGWDRYDPCYYDRKVPSGAYSHVVCVNVLSAVSRDVRKEILRNIHDALEDKGQAFLCVPRNLPAKGKFSGCERRPQTNVQYGKPLSILEENNRFAIYVLKKGETLLESVSDKSICPGTV